MADIALLASRYASRPLLMTADAAQDLALRIRAIDARALERPSRISALLRRVGLSNGGKVSRTAHAMDDDVDATPSIPIEEQLAYSPRWLGDVEDMGFCWSLKDGVALMCCDTVLVERGDEFCGQVWHGYDTLLLALREALADVRVKGVFLVLDSPGGVAGSGLPELAAFMREAREAAGGKPIWIYARMACSAAYWIAASGDRVLAGQFAYVGSLGAVVGHENISGALDKAGIEITTVEFPENAMKTEGARWKALTAAGRAAWQADINQLGETFFADVTAGRAQLTHDGMMAMGADAFMAQHADPARSGLALGLVDEIATEEEAFALLVAHVSASADDNPQPTEGQMASKPQAGAKAPAAQVAQAEKAMRVAEANLAKAKASAAAADPDQSDDDDKDPSTALPGEGDDEDGAEGGDDDEDEDEDEQNDDAPAASAAVAIAKSAEAKAHPHLANAAIASGQTLAQFRATVAAAGSAPRTSKLDRAMIGSRRLGADGAAGKATMASAVQKRIEANRGKQPAG